MSVHARKQKQRKSQTQERNENKKIGVFCWCTFCFLFFFFFAYKDKKSDIWPQKQCSFVIAYFWQPLNIVKTACSSNGNLETLRVHIHVCACHEKKDSIVPRDACINVLVQSKGYRRAPIEERTPVSYALPSHVTLGVPPSFKKSLAVGVDVRKCPYAYKYSQPYSSLRKRRRAALIIVRNRLQLEFIFGSRLTI